MDTITPEMRSKVMSAIHSRDTLPEMRVRKMLWANGYRFRVCDKLIVGHPDIVFPKRRDVEHLLFHRERAELVTRFPAFVESL